MSEVGVTRDAVRRLHKVLPGIEIALSDKSGSRVEFEWDLVQTIQTLEEPAEPAPAPPIPVPPVELEKIEERR